MQPQLRQMPPRCSRSTTAVLNPSCAARIAATYPPGPPPMTMMSYWFAMVLIPLRVLRDSVTEGPVFLFDFDQVDEHILRAKAGLCPQILRDSLEQGLLLIEGSRVADGDLNDDEI